jgi:hypothetical protein
MARFQTVIKSARFVYSPYTATEMQGFGQVPADSIRARWPGTDRGAEAVFPGWTEKTRGDAEFWT